jgi:hypothetical protein
LLVAGQLPQPEIPVIGWDVGMLGAAVPKASINKYCELQCRKYKIRTAE